MVTRQEVVTEPLYPRLFGYLLGEYEIPRLQSARHVDPGRLIYHYTDAAGLLGLLQSREFWATDSAFLNDPSEGNHALEVARAVLTEKRAASRGGTEEVLDVLGDLSEDDEPNMTSFVTSFCRSGDLLSQWRGYAAFGRGYALGFREAEMVPSPSSDKLVEVDYDAQRLRDYWSDAVEIFLEHAAAKPKEYASYASQYVTLLRQIDHAFKHPAFSEEGEVRLVLRRHPVRDTRLMYRTRGPDIVPYLAQGVWAGAGKEERFPLREVVFGPGVPRERNMYSIRNLLDGLGYTHVTLRGSEAPFE